VDFEQVFARQVTALSRAGDVTIAISTSGNSTNVREGMKAAKAAGLRQFS
jgi:D-sedoheptulose 7-phosphate isomerase